MLKPRKPPLPNKKMDNYFFDANKTHKEASSKKNNKIHGMMWDPQHPMKGSQHPISGIKIQRCGTFHDLPQLTSYDMCPFGGRWIPAFWMIVQVV